VLPNVNHCMPEAIAKSVGDDDLKIPATLPNRSPDIPVSNDISLGTHLDDHTRDAMSSTIITWTSLFSKADESIQVIRRCLPDMPPNCNAGHRTDRSS
jgi:hypothetical protein